MKKPRRRSKVARFDPELMQKLRAEIAKHPNPMFGEFIKEARPSDSDVMDFAMTAAYAYFSGALLEPVKESARRELYLMRRRTVLVTAAKFGMTAIFDKDGCGATLKPAWKDDDPDTQIAAVQALVDTGMSVKDAMAEFASGPPKPGHMAETIHTQLPALVH